MSYRIPVSVICTAGLLVNLILSIALIYCSHRFNKMALHQEENMSDELWYLNAPTDKTGDFEEIDFDTALLNKSYRSAAHGMFYALTDQIFWERYKLSAFVLMQMRFEGTLGFPGGIIDAEDASPVEALNRELVEEMNVDLSCPASKNCAVQRPENGSTVHSSPQNALRCDVYCITQADHIISHINHKKKLITHFYAKQITEEMFTNMERRALEARDWGTETLGIMRVPLYVFPHDNRRGFPLFLANQFVGNAREQLLITLRKRNILPEDQLDAMIETYKKHL